MRRAHAALSLAPAILLLCAAPGAAQKPSEGRKLAPFVSSPKPVVERMLELAGVKAGEIVYDLGCGDGRIPITAAQKYAARAVGVEISEALAKKARSEVQSLGLDERQVRIVRGDMMAVDLSEADVVALYLLTEANEQLRPKLERELRPGARVVSLDFQIRGWKPAKVEKFEAHRRPYTLYLYEIPKR